MTSISKTKSNAFELTTDIGRLSDISATWIDLYDGVYLGDPFCHLLESNLLQNKTHLKEAVSILKSAGKKVYLSTYLEPWTDEMDKIKDVIAFAKNQGIDAIEVLNEGVLYMVCMDFPDTDIHINGFVRAANARAINVFKKYHATRFMPYYELSLEEINRIQSDTTLPIELPVHGYFPLGHAEFCMIHPKRVKIGPLCKGDCYDGYTLKHRNREVTLTASGRVTSSGKELCMFEHLESLVKSGFSIFRIAAKTQTSEYRAAIGKAYRNAISSAMSNQKFEVDLSPLMLYNRDGFCNGYYFGQPGMTYIDNHK